MKCKCIHGREAVVRPGVLLSSCLDCETITGSGAVFLISPVTLALDNKALVQRQLTETLKARGNQYGPYDEMACIAQRLKEIVRIGVPSNWAQLQDVERESLDMIFTKIARIVIGAPLQEDSWHDIAGYASLVEREIRESRGADTERTGAGSGSLDRRGPETA